MTAAAVVAAGPGGSGASAWSRATDRALTDALRSLVAGAWRRGWQPADVARHAVRELGAGHLPLVRAAIAAELSGYAAVTVDPVWAGQVAAMEATVWWPPDHTLVAGCAPLYPRGRLDLVMCALDLISLLTSLPTIEMLGPLPGSAAASARGAQHQAVRSVDERVLNRVRALLAKAESTTFPAEAETFTAGAQALMARHSIDHALLAAAGRAPSDAPGGRRIGIDNPYEAPKASLLSAVARANRCKVVWSKQFGFATVIGYPTDVDGVELLFTSLLVQATTAMTQAGARTDSLGRSRTRSFRQAFLLSYAHRISERLTEATGAQTRQAAAAAKAEGSDLLPVLAARDEQVGQALSALFPKVSYKRVGSTVDGEGWAHGRAAADLAALDVAAQLPG